MVDTNLDARVATTNRAANESNVQVFPTGPSKIRTGKSELADGVLHAESIGPMPLDPFCKKDHAADEGSVGVSATIRLS